MKKTPLATEIAGDEEGSSTLIPQNGDFSLYFHVPFCIKKCDYCHFYVVPDQERFKAKYLQALKKEWQLRVPILPHLFPASIYFGGGTPTLLGPDAICHILSWINPPNTCEITLEANPENVSVELMQAFCACGINRVSLGVQSFDEHILKTLSRTHSTTKAQRSVEYAQQAGFDNISIDLMYDIPGQTLATWKNTLNQALALPITHLSLYNLTIEPHTVFYKKRREFSFPKEKLSLAFLKSALKSLQKGKMHRYEISAFAQQGYYSRHNMGYWNGRPFLGFGPSACSYWNGERFRNIANLNRYANALETGVDPIDFREKLAEKERLKESLAIGLRLTEGIPLPELSTEIANGVQQLEELGLLVNDLHHIRLTEKGLLLHDSVAEHIMSL